MESYKAWMEKQVNELHKTPRQSNGSQVSKVRDWSSFTLFLFPAEESHLFPCSFEPNETF